MIIAETLTPALIGSITTLPALRAQAPVSPVFPVFMVIIVFKTIPRLESLMFSAMLRHLQIAVLLHRSGPGCFLNISSIFDL